MLSKQTAENQKEDPIILEESKVKVLLDKPKTKKTQLQQQDSKDNVKSEVMMNVEFNSKSEGRC